MASGMDLESFVDASEVAEGIGSEVPENAEYQGFEGDEEQTETQEEPTDEVGEAEDDDQGEEYEEAETDEVDEEETEEEESEDSEEEPELTGDRETDGKNKAMWAAREKARKLAEEKMEVEKELAFLKGQQQATQPKQQEAPKPPDVGEPPEFDWSDVDGSVKAQLEWERKAYATQQQFKAQQEATNRWNAVVEASRRVAKSRHADYDQVEAAWLTRANTPGNEHLQLMLQNQPDPAAWAYQEQKGFEAQSTQESPEVVALKKELAELKAKQKAPKTRKKKPGSRRPLSKARGGKKTSKPVAEKQRQEQEKAMSNLFASKLRPKS